ncbi:MAG: hypothetical protein LRZ84_02785 [Desertifilum sp.]|nr:hypothetical protein [Desertifilum sp.]
MTSKDNLALKNIAEVMANLPSESLLDKAITSAQKEEWKKVRETQELISEYWISKYVYKDINYHPLEDALDCQQISHKKAELIAVYVNEYKARWDLCQVAAKYVEEFHGKLQVWNSNAQHFPKPVLQIWDKFFRCISLGKYPFGSPYELFIETLKEDVDGSFSICLEPYYDVPLKKWKQGTKQYIQILDRVIDEGNYPDLLPKQAYNLKKQLVWNKISFSWLGLILFTCHLNTASDPLLRQKFIAHSQVLQEVLRLTVKASFGMSGFAWYKGEILQASGKGQL